MGRSLCIELALNPKQSILRRDLTHYYDVIVKYHAAIWDKYIYTYFLNKYTSLVAYNAERNVGIIMSTFVKHIIIIKVLKNLMCNISLENLYNN